MNILHDAIFNAGFHNFPGPLHCHVLILFFSYDSRWLLRPCQSALLYNQILCGACFLRFILTEISMRTQLWSLMPGSTLVLITLSWMLVAIKSWVLASRVGSFNSCTRPFPFRKALKSSYRLMCWQVGFSCMSVFGISHVTTLLLILTHRPDQLSSLASIPLLWNLDTG